MSLLGPLNFSLKLGSTPDPRRGSLQRLRRLAVAMLCRELGLILLGLWRRTGTQYSYCLTFPSKLILEPGSPGSKVREYSRFSTPPARAQRVDGDRLTTLFELSAGSREDAW
jgi:hypothetical protein